MRLWAFLPGALVALAVAGVPADAASETASVPVVPVPAEVHAASGSFTLTAGSRVAISGDVGGVAEDLAAILRPSTGFLLPIVSGVEAGSSDIALRVAPAPVLGQEGYRLKAGVHGLALSANTAEGLFRGVQTVRQLFPAAIESTTQQPGPWTITGVRILDRPRFAWRGAMLDVARHFMSVAEVERYIDEIALYKVDVLHLHLSDDQGWRIAIPGWPRLTSYGGSLEVSGTPGGSYTAADYQQIVAYAAARYVTIVPEIDTPGHTNAALASYGRL